MHSENVLSHNPLGSYSQCPKLLLVDVDFMSPQQIYNIDRRACPCTVAFILSAKASGRAGPVDNYRKTYVDQRRAASPPGRAEALLPPRFPAFNGQLTIVDAELTNLNVGLTTDWK